MLSLSRLRPRGGRRAEPAGRDALLRSRRGDAAARSGVVSNFDYVVFDMPRTWFSWTDSVLLGSNKLFIVSEMTVPALRHGQAAGGGDPRAAGRRAEAAGHRQPLRAAHVRRRACGCNDSEQALGDDFAAVIPNNYALVREAIDRGVPLDEVKPGNKITAAAQEAGARRSRGEGGRRQAARRLMQEAQAASRVGEGSAMAGRFTVRRAAAAGACRSIEAPPAGARTPMSWSRSFRTRRRPTPRRSRPIRCTATSCSTPRCACTAG